MKRYYLSKIKQYSEPGLGDFWGHHLQQAYPGVDYQGGEIKVDPQTGVPTEKALLVLVGGIDHRTYQADPELVALPAVDLDVKVSSIHAATKVGAKANIKTRMGYSDAEVDAAWDNADGLRDVINHYGRLNNDTFDANNFDLTDL